MARSLVLAVLTTLAVPVLHAQSGHGAARAQVLSGEARLSPTGAAGSDYVGHSVSISGDRALVGAPGGDDNGTESGAAYVFVWTGSQWVQEATLLPADGSTGDFFGASVAISGDRAVVGATFDDATGTDSGSAYVFVRSGSTWTQEARLTASAQGRVQFGSGVSIEGSRVLVTAPFEPGPAPENQGSAYVFVRSGSSWSVESVLRPDVASDDLLGFGGASLSGDRALVGAEGAAYIYVRSGGVWAREARLAPPDARTEVFGRSVALSGDVALIGAPEEGDDDENGAYVFVRSGSSWTEQARLFPDDAGDPSQADVGQSVALVGTRALVGAAADADPATRAGSAYVFVGSGGTWTQQAKLFPADDAATDGFGAAVALSADRAVVGASYDASQGPATGAAYVFPLSAPDTDLVVTTTGDEPNDTLSTEEDVCDVDRSEPDLKCTLRAAIEVANARAGRDSVSFAIDGAGPHVVTLGAPLPALAEPLVLDATTQPGYAGLPLVEVTGTGEVGLDLSVGQTTVRGFAIGGFSGAGVRIRGPGGNRVEASHLGVDAAGTSATPNGGGVLITASPGNTIGGPTLAQRNVISGNTGAGVVISGATATGNLVAGNHIGVTLAGTAALGNGAEGVSVDGAPGVRIGGPTEGERNVIAGNRYSGVLVEGETAGGAVIAGNYVGVDATGIAALPNDQADIATYGVQVIGAPDVRVGGTTEGERNVILQGIQIGGTGSGGDVTTDGIRVQGNYVNLGADGATVPDEGATRGIDVRFSSDVVIGGATAMPGQAPGNVVLGDGISVSGTAERPADDLRVSGNLLGTDATGGQVLGVGTDGGITVAGFARGVRIGEAGGGNVVVLDNGTGIEIEEVGGAGIYDVHVVENRIGTSADGSLALATPRTGITVGREDGIEGVVITDNRVNAYASGIRVRGPRSAGAEISRNTVGLLADGTAALPDRMGYNGIVVFFADGVTLDGNTVGNYEVGMVVASNESTIVNNRLGTNPEGTQARPNEAGLIVPRSLNGQPIGSGTVVGAEGAGNVISGNLEAGLKIGSALTSSLGVGTTGDGRVVEEGAARLVPSSALLGVVVAHNRIGTTASGTSALLPDAPGRSDIGIVIVGGTGTVIEQNLISGNALGVVLAGDAADLPETTLLAANRIGLSLIEGAFIPNTLGLFVAESEDTRLGATVVGGTLVGNVFGGSGTHLLVSGAESVQVRLASFLGAPDAAISFGNPPPADAPQSPRLLTAVVRTDDVVARVAVGASGPLDVFVAADCMVPHGRYVTSANGVAGSATSVVAGLGAIGTAEPVGLYLTATSTTGPPDASAATSTFSECLRIARPQDVADVTVADGQTGPVLTEPGIDVDITENGGSERTSARATSGATGGTLYAARYALAPEPGPFEGTAPAPDGSTVTPDALAADLYWTLRADGLGGVTYTACLDAGAAPSQVVVHRASPAAPWMPVATTLDERGRLCGAGLTAFGDLAAATGAVAPGGPSVPAVSFAGVQEAVAESIGTHVLRLTLSDVLDGPAGVTISLTSGDPADLGGFTTATIEIPAYTGTVEVPISVTDDRQPEGDETFVFQLSVPNGNPGLTLGDRTTTALVVVDDDAGNVTVTVPARDADGDGADDGGPRLLAVPVSGVTAGELAAEAGGAVWTVVGDALVRAEPAAMFVAGQPVVVDVAPGAEITLSGGPSGASASFAVGGDGRRLVAVGNPTAAPVALAGLAVDGGVLADVALVFEGGPSGGAFRPVSLDGLPEDTVLPPFGAVVVQVLTDRPGTVTLSLTAVDGGEDVTGAPFLPTDGESLVVLSLVPTRAAPGSAGDVLVVRLSAAVDSSRWGLDVVSPLGPTLGAARKGAGSSPWAAVGAVVEPGSPVVVPLDLHTVDLSGDAHLVLNEGPARIAGRPVTVEILDRGVPTALAPGDTLVVAGALEPGRFALRLSTSVGVDADGPPVEAHVGPVFPNPTSGRAELVVTVIEAGPLRVSVCDMLGREVAVAYDGEAGVGTTRVAVGERGLVPGAYLVRVVGTTFAEVRRLTVTR